MAGYSKPKIFKSNRQGQFTKFLNAHWRTPFDQHLASESDRLRPVFEAVSNTLMPYAKRDRDQARLSTSKIVQTFSDIGLANGSLIFGTPIIIPEQNFLYPTTSQSFAESTFGSLDAKHLKPDGYKRMFWTSAFGLLRVKSDDQDNSYILPTNTVPQDFLDIEGITPVIEAAAKLSSITNHDYFHQIIYSSIAKSFQHRNPNAALNRFRNADRRLEQALDRYTLDRHFDVNATVIEPWAMRFHAEILQTLLQQDQNIMTQAVDDFCTAVTNCSALQSAKGRMSTPPVSVQDYATRLLAFNIIRATPLDHPFTQECIEKIKDALAASNNPASNGVDEIFDHMYQTQYKAVLFGDGNHDFKSKCESPEEYSDKIKKLSAHSVVLAQRDCERVFTLQAEYEASATNDNSPRARRLARIEKIQMYEDLLSNQELSAEDPA